MSQFNIPPPNYQMAQESLHGRFATINDIAQAVLDGSLNPHEFTVAQLTKIHINLDIWNQLENDRRKTETECISRFTQEIFRRQLENLSTAPNHHAHGNYRTETSMNVQTSSSSVSSSWSNTTTEVDTNVPGEFAYADDSTVAQADESAYDGDLSQAVTDNQEDVQILEEFPRRWSDDQLPQTGFQAWSPLAESSPIDYEEEECFTPN